MIDRDELALERGSLIWSELVRHFARGVVVVVNPGLDLLAVAEAMARDDRKTFAEWMSQGLILHADDHHARRWEANSQALDAIVVAPWVLVSETPFVSPTLQS